MENTLTQTFVADLWEETGEMGYRPASCSSAFDPINYAPGLAHDFMEHAGNFTVEGEIMAHASMYLLRYEGGFLFDGQWNPLDLASIAAEWTNLYHGIQKEGCLDSCPAQPKLDETNEEELAEIVSRGKRLLLEEIGKEYLDTDTYAQLSQHFADWFRKGYHEAEQRFAEIGTSLAQGALWEVERFFDQALKNELLGGERVTVSLDLDSGQVTITQEAECFSCGHPCDAEQSQCDDCIEYEREDEEEDEE